MRSSIHVVVIAALALASSACAAKSNGYGVDAPPGDAASGDGHASSDAPFGGDASSCVTIAFDPPSPTSNATVGATASGAPGPYTWSVSFEGAAVPTSPVGSDGSQIDFFPNAAGVYTVVVQTGQANCSLSVNLSVGQIGGVLADYVEVVVPPASLAPPQSTEFQIPGGSNVDRAIAIDPGLAVSGTITNASGSGIAAYVSFTSSAEQHTAIETFTASNGAFALRMLGEPYTALVVPAVPGVPPAQVAWTPGTTISAALPAGTATTGTVLDPTGAALAGASVQLSDGTVPSTIATTSASGAFTVLDSYAPGATVTVTVTPPSGRGLPALSASVTLGTMQVQYASTLATCGVGGVAVQRAGVNQPGVGVTFVGAIAAAGTMTVGGVATPAAGSVQIATTTSATGTLPALAVPKAALSAVVAVAPNQGDYAVASANLSACSLATITAPAPQPATTTIFDASGNALSGVLAHWLPVGALAAGGAAELDTMTTTGGALAVKLASGGQYDLLLADPQGRAGPVYISSLTSTGVPSPIALTKALVLSGAVSVTAGPNVVPGVAIQIYCASCTTNGNGPVRPIAQTATDLTSHFQVAIPDPGTM